VVKSYDKRLEYNLDQINIPDPVAQELTALKQRIEELEKKLEE